MLCYAVLCMSDIIWFFIWFLCLCMRYLFSLCTSASYKLSLFAYKLTHAHTRTRTHNAVLAYACSHACCVFFLLLWRRQRKIAFICTTFTQLNTDRTSSIYWKSWWLFFKCIHIDEWENIKKKNIRQFRYSPQAHARTHAGTHVHSHMESERVEVMARPTNVDRLLAHSLAHIFKSVRCYGFFHYLCLSSFYGLIAYSRPLYKKGIRLHIIVRNAHAHSESECCENSLSRIPFLKW